MPTDPECWEDRFNAAIASRRVGDLETALAGFERLAATASTSKRRVGALRMVGGILLHDLSRPTDAELVFEECVRLAPRWEPVSVGLFHALIAQKKATEALDEMKRFLGLRSSEEYTRLLAEMRET